MNDRSRQLVARAVRFYSEYDEDMFFAWLDKLVCIDEYHGEGIDLLIALKDGPVDDNSLRELLALFNRYGIDMTQLAVLETETNRPWFRDANGYWYGRVFQAA